MTENKAWLFPIMICLLLPACTSTPNMPEAPPFQWAKIRQVSVSEDIRVPDGFVFEPAPSRVDNKADAAGVAAAVLKPLLGVRPPEWDRNADIREFVRPEVLIPENLYQSFCSELARRTSKPPIPPGSEPPADAEFVFFVEKMDWTDTVLSPFTGHSKPRLTVTALLIGNPPCRLVPDSKAKNPSYLPEDPRRNPILWKSQVQVTGTYRPAWAPAWNVNSYVRKPEILSKSLGALANEAGTLLADQSAAVIGQDLK